jgi:hypothetical protein
MLILGTKKRRNIGPDLGGALPGSRMGSRGRRQTGRTPALGVDPRIDAIMIAELARFSLGRVLLHLVSMLGDRAFRFHAAGMMRELSWVAGVATPLARVCTSWQQAARVQSESQLWVALAYRFRAYRSHLRVGYSRHRQT